MSRTTDSSDIQSTLADMIGRIRRDVDPEPEEDTEEWSSGV